MFVIKHPVDNTFVAKPGSLHSFTKNLKDAQKFSSREEAEKHKCSDEFVVDLEKLLDEYRS